MGDISEQITNPISTTRFERVLRIIKAVYNYEREVPEPWAEGYKSILFTLANSLYLIP